MKRKMIRVLAVGMASVFVLSGCGNNEALPELKESSYQSEEIVKVEQRDIEDVEFCSGYIMGDLHVLSFERDGKLEDIKVPLGKEIHKGDVIATLSNEEMDEQIGEMDTQIADRNNQKTDAVALIQNEIAQRNLERKYAEQDEDKKVCDIEIQKLKRKIQYEEDICRLELQEMNAERDKLVKKREKDSIVAPEDGQVIDLSPRADGDGFIQVGDEITAGNAVVFFEGNGKPYLVSPLETASMEGTSADMTGKRLVAQCSAGAFEVKEKKYGKTVSRAAEKLGYDLLKRFEAVEKDAGFVMGEQALLEIHSNEKKQVLAVPVEALERDGEERYVYVSKNGEKEKRVVEVGTTTSTDAEITKGLTEGEEIVVYRYEYSGIQREWEMEETVKRGSFQDTELIEGSPDREDREIQQIKYTEEKGTFQKLVVKEGDTVKAGDVVAYIKGTTKESEVLQAEMALEEAREARNQVDTDAARQLKDLNKSLKEAKEDYEKESLRLQIQSANLQYSSGVRSANAALEKARKEYNRLYEKYTGEPVRAGISGKVKKTTELKKGEEITSGEIICSIEKTSKTYYKLSDWQVHPGCKITLTDTDGKNHTAKAIGMYRYFEMPVDVADYEKWYATSMALDKYYDENISIENMEVQGLSMKDVLCIPTNAVDDGYHNGYWTVYVKNGDSVEKRDVKIGYWGWENETCYVYSGLEEGDVVLCYDLQ